MQTTLTRIFIDLESVSDGLSEMSRKDRKFKGFFRPKLGDLQKKKKKKRSSPKFRAIFLPISQVQTFEGGLFSYGGGAIFHFSQKIGLKSTKNMRFCILHKPMGGGSSPPPGYATDHYGIREVANELIKSYLSDRFQYVELDNVKSSRINIKYGVPQGSILGPLLFILYINDLPNSLINQPTLFADDTCILISNHSLVNLETQSNDELKSVSEWMIANRLTLNPHKIQALVLTRSKQKLQPFLLSLNNIFIEIRQSVKYLSIHLDSTLNFTSHTQMVERRVSTAIGILCKLKSMAPVKILLSVYYAIVFPHLMYGILLWGCSSKNNLHKLQMLQNKCLRIIEGWQLKQKLEPLFIKFEIFNIDQLLNFEIAKFMFLYQRNKLPQLFNNYFSYIKVITSRQTRKADKDDLYLPLYKTKRAQKSIKYVGVKIWNDIPLKIRTLPFNKFQQKYKLHLFQKSATTQK